MFGFANEVWESLLMVEIYDYFRSQRKTLEGFIPVFNLVLSGHTYFNFANKTTVISFRPHGYPATILTTISISDTSSN